MVLDAYSILSVVMQGSGPFLLVILHNISAEALGFPFPILLAPRRFLVTGQPKSYHSKAACAKCDQGTAPKQSKSVPGSVRLGSLLAKSRLMPLCLKTLAFSLILVKCCNLMPWMYVIPNGHSMMTTDYSVFRALPTYKISWLRWIM